MCLIGVSVHTDFPFSRDGRGRKALSNVGETAALCRRSDSEQIETVEIRAGSRVSPSQSPKATADTASFGKLNRLDVPRVFFPSKGCLTNGASFRVREMPSAFARTRFDLLRIAPQNLARFKVRVLPNTSRSAWYG